MRAGSKIFLSFFTLVLPLFSLTPDAAGYLWLWDVYFATPLKGWVAGEDRVLSTADGGLTWKTQKIAGAGEVRLAFRTPEVGWIFGLTRFLQTTDGGETWRDWRPPVSAAGGIYFPTPKVGWIPTNRKHVFKTTDGGRTWKRQSLGRETGGIIECFSERQCIISGMKGMVLTTADGGGRWVERKVPAEDAFTVLLRVTPDGSAWAVGYVPYALKYYLLRSDDKGQKWRIVDGVTPLMPPHSAFFWSRKRGLLAGRGIYLTEDGGVTWFPAQTPDDTGFINAVHFVDERLGWAVCDNVILHTKDGGKTWARQYTDPDVYNPVTPVPFDAMTP